MSLEENFHLAISGSIESPFLICPDSCLGASKKTYDQDLTKNSLTKNGKLKIDTGAKSNEYFTIC